MFIPGDVVRFHSPTAGKMKFHLCVRAADDLPCRFLFINSGSGFKGDVVLEDGTIPGLPPSPTGESVVSFSQVVRMGVDRLRLFRAEKIGEIDAHLAGELLAFASGTKVLAQPDRAVVCDGFQAILDRL